MADIFVSYTSADRDWAFWIGQELGKLDHMPRIHEWEIPGGGNIAAWMEERHEKADHILCVISEVYLTRPYSTWERLAAQWAAATTRPNFALPVFIDNCNAPTLLAQFKRCDLAGLSEDAARALLAAFLAPATRPAGAMPFPGGGRTPPSPPRPGAVSFPAAANSRTEGRLEVDALFRHGVSDGWLEPGAGKLEWFQDHELGPEMVVVPAGEFTMGSSASEIAALEKEFSTDRYHWEGPQHVVRIMAPFAVGRFAVTFDEWEACIADGGGTGYWPGDQGWGRGKRPVINVSFDDAMAYVAWLSSTTGTTYRLLSEAEREYVTRAGTRTAFWWGDTISTEQANYDGNYVFRGGEKGEYRKKTVPVDSFESNPWGLYNVHGNVWEWCEDIWRDNYDGAPIDGSAWLQGGDSSTRVVRGGSWGYYPQILRAAIRIRISAESRIKFLGFRVARTLTP